MILETLSPEYSFTNGSRAFCPKCDFLKSRCLCDTLQVIPNQVHLIILQHPTETKHPLNTVRIMKKSFKNITVLIGEDFSENSELNSLISNSKHNVNLLYPDSDALILEKKSNNQNQPITHLIVIDGTWRKAKKIYLLSKNLHGLKTLKLIPQEKSDYRIRKSPNENALSTLEACAEALAYLEPALNTSSALFSFKTMIEMQIQKMGRRVYQSNYLYKKKE